MESHDPNPVMPEGEAVRFQLYVAGESPRSRRAIENIRLIVEMSRDWRCEVEVIDVLASPERAEQERILATPTLIRESPPPRRRITGDLSDHAKVLQVLGPGGPLRQHPSESPPLGPPLP